MGRKEYKCFACSCEIVKENCKVQVVVTDFGVFYFCQECFDKIFPYVKKAMKMMNFKGMKEKNGT